jgi:hypothetical protein
MSLRDAAALTVLPAVVRACVPFECNAGETMEQMFARKAFACADAFLEARSATTQAPLQPQSQPQPPQRGDIYIDPPGASGTWIVWHTDPNGVSELIPVRDDFRMHIWRVATKDLKNPARNKHLWGEVAK